MYGQGRIMTFKNRKAILISSKSKLSSLRINNRRIYVLNEHSSRMHTDHAVTRPSSEPVAMRPIVDRQTPVKTLPFLAVGNKQVCEMCGIHNLYCRMVQIACLLRTERDFQSPLAVINL